MKKFEVIDRLKNINLTYYHFSLHITSFQKRTWALYGYLDHFREKPESFNSRLNSQSTIHKY